MENPTNTKSKLIKKSIFILISTLIKKYNQNVNISTSFLHLISLFDHSIIPISEILENLSKEYNYNNIARDIISEIARISPQDIARDTSGTKNFSIFLVEITERLPSLIFSLLPILLPHLDGESYVMRSSIIQVIGFILCKVTSTSQLPISSDKKDSLFDILEDRFRDIHSFTRSKTLQTWSYLIQ